MEPIKEEKAIEAEEPGNFASFMASLGITERRSKILAFFVVSAVLLSSYTSFNLMAPSGFPNGKIITIKKGDSLTAVSALLNKENLIRSPYYFELCAKIVGGTKPIIAGQYLFKEPISACRVALRIAHGVSGVPEIRVTIPEGMSNKQIVVILEKNIPGFDSVFFLEHARSQEGFLFPDTYSFQENTTAQSAVTIMLENFNKRIEPWRGAIEASGRTIRDIVIMASILEKEATTEEDRAIVSGILWKRISIGMPLQVDASFLYLLGKKSSEVTVTDLKMKSSYNTYVNKGLPGGPIGNPGISAIRAAIQPTISPYLYYLSDNDGIIHYSKTFEEHKANKAKYLR